MKDLIDTLFTRLDACYATDRGILITKLKKARERMSTGQPADRLLAEISQLIEKSTARVSARQEACGQIRYPDLPVAERREEIQAAIAVHQVVVVAGETGSGKTTQLPKMCLELGLASRGMIGHTQPRRLAARAVASRIAEELQTPLGELVGYQVRFSDQTSDSTQIKLMTDGILLAETQHDPLLRQYQVLIIDEAHERSLNIDFLLGYIKRILPKRPDLKVIITSATIDLERFSQHFDNAPILQVSGRTYPVDVQYRPVLDESGEERTFYNAIEEAVAEIIQLDKVRQGPQDVLVFLTGEREIREAADVLRKAALPDTEIMPLYARLSSAEQNRIFHGARHAGRRIVLSTNVAETSITVPNIGYVIDTGVARISRYSYRSKVQRLPIEPISKASANQRAGRCGRIAPGVCFRLYSEEDYLQRPDFTDAEIQRTNLAAVILQMLSLKLGDIADFPFVDRPDNRFINDGFKLLQELGAVNADKKLTTTGRQLGKLPVDPRLGRMLLEAGKQNALREVITIVSALSVQDPRERPADKQQAADQKHKEYADEQSDFLTLLNLWELYEAQRQELSQSQLKKFCQRQFLSYPRMREWRDIHRQLHISCQQIGMKENAEPADYRAVHVSLLAGLLSHMGVRQEKKEFLGARNRKFYIFPASSLYKKPPKWIITAELVETSKLYARTIARIEPEWAESLAGHLCKKNYLEPAWHKKRAQVMATEQVSLYGLLIIPKRLVNYGAIDAPLAHEIFIRQALVEGEYKTAGAFFNHNRQLLRDVEALESKSRRKDLLVDEEALYQFYHNKIASLGGADIVNGRGFEAWRKTVESDNPKALFLQKEDILQRSSDHVSHHAYPDELVWKGMRLKLSYHFSPGAEDDGISLQVPIGLLKQLSAKRLEWLVPGMLQEKCEALIRALPKQIRRNYVPAPDYASAAVEAMVFGEGDLKEALAHQLLRMSGNPVPPDAWENIELPAHLALNIQLLDASGKQIGQGRDWEALCQRYGHLAEASVQQSPEDDWGKKSLIRWDFGELEQKVAVRQAGGITLDAWPMLVDRQTSVDLALSMNAAYAEKETRKAVVRLALLALKPKLAKKRNLIPRLSESVMLTGKLFTGKKLEADILFHSMQKALALHESKPLPRNQHDFEVCVNHAAARLDSCIQESAEQVFALHRQYHEISKQLNGQVRLDAVSILNDIKQQLGHLIHSDYLQLPPERLVHYSRYLQAISLRLEKFAQEIPRQRMLTEQLQQFWQAYQKLLAQKQAMQEWDSELEAYRWYLEEYRVSLFAQQLGVAESVSDKRIKQRWQALV